MTEAFDRVPRAETTASTENFQNQKYEEMLRTNFNTWRLKPDTTGTTYNLCFILAYIFIHWKRSYNGVNLSNATTLLNKKNLM